MITNTMVDMARKVLRSFMLSLWFEGIDTAIVDILEVEDVPVQEKCGGDDT